MSIAYNSNNIPKGGLSVVFYRPISGDAPGAAGADTLLGTYLVESLTPTESATVNKRPNTDGGENGWWIVAGDVEGAIKVQLATTATPWLTNGDYFETATLFINSAGAGVNRRFVVHGMAPEVSSAYRSQSGNVIVDQHAP